ncbi:hypothetical protein DPEC_G00351080 [Dallia pectoralis]|uniref:Uncharacterized protein n=1 Tax=Dallia pectoralis TaxID=75939 RepID=A0ACC2F1Q6_DALPE|nr:hypothetical protein DPEC_G00351080 [Dallia pectoralis]
MSPLAVSMETLGVGCDLDGGEGRQELQVQETRSKKVPIKIYLYHLFELQACPPAVKTGTFSPEQYVRRDAHQGKVVIAKGKNKEPVIVHHLCDNEKTEEPGVTRYYRLLGCSIKPRDRHFGN